MLLISPAVLLLIYFAIYRTSNLLLFIFFCTPLSINIEEFNQGGIGLFLPSEPLLIGLFLLTIFLQLKSKFIPIYLIKNPIVQCLFCYFAWIIVSAMFSYNMIVSIKFLLSKLWFVIPLFCLGSLFFQITENIRRFIWLFSFGMCVVIVYTVSMHATFNFGEKESHWVMFPFFKDHTIYGAIAAFILPLLISKYYSKTHTNKHKIILICMILINLIGLFFSYTRAAWLSIIVALFVWGLIHFRIKLKYLILTGSVCVLLILSNWTQIQFMLSKNKSEHTTEDFGKRLQSAGNVTTDASNLERINRWDCAISMFKERPIVGFGPGTYAFEYARFQRPENLTIISTNFGDGGNAHSEYLGALAETGLIGFLLTLGLVFIIFRQGIHLYYNLNLHKELQILVLGMILALVTYFFHGLLNNYLDTDKAAVPIWTICVIFIVLDYKLKQGLLSNVKTVEGNIKH